MTNTKLILISDNGVETFEHFTGVIPRVGESVVFYKQFHDGCQYGGVVKNVHYRIEFEQQNNPRNISSIQIVEVRISESKIRP
jgi:hypothetical protein